MKKEESPIELWRWKMIRKVADYINQPDDIKGYIPTNFN